MDSERTLTPSKRYKLFLEIKHLGILNWNTSPVRLIYVPKPDARQRPIGITTIKDRVIQNVIKNALESEWEAKFEISFYRFRPGRRWIMRSLVLTVFSSMLQNTGFFKVIYISASTKLAILIFCTNSITFSGQNLIGKWLKSGILFQLVYFDNEEGTPQESVIFSLVWNIPLRGGAWHKRTTRRTCVWELLWGSFNLQMTLSYSEKPNKTLWLCTTN